MAAHGLTALAGESVHPLAFPTNDPSAFFKTAFAELLGGGKKLNKPQTLAMISQRYKEPGQPSTTR